MRLAMKQLVFLPLFAIAALTGRANGSEAKEAVQAWQPTSEVVEVLEHAIALPPRAKPLSSYARYYTGEVVEGRKLVRGYYLSESFSETFAADKPGVYLRASKALVADGGCAVITVYYDPASKSFAAITCNGYA